MSRMLAAKAALAIRVDALGEDTNVELGMEHRAMLEKRMRSIFIDSLCKQETSFVRYKAK